MVLAVISVLFLVAAILAAHFIAPPEYNWRVHTISELAAQKYRNGPVMRAGFIGFGILLSSAVLLKWISASFPVKYIPLMVYSASVLISGLFSTSPFISNLDFSVREAKIHSFFAQLAGFSFSVGILLFMIYEDRMGLKIVHFAFFLFVILTSLLFGRIHRYRGILQRLLYLGSFVWLVIFLGLLHKV